MGVFKWVRRMLVAAAVTFSVLGICLSGRTCTIGIDHMEA